MNIDDLTIGQAKQLSGMFGGSTQKRSHSFTIGGCYFIRTVTMNHTGRVVAVTDSDIELEDASWIADTGRFSDAMKTGNLNEVEPFPGTAYVSRAAIVDSAAGGIRFLEIRNDPPNEKAKAGAPMRIFR